MTELEIIEKKEALPSDIKASLHPPAIIALSEYELATFFPGTLGTRLKSLLGNAVIVQGPAVTVQSWEALLNEIRPEIIVSCWRTHRIPAGLKTLRYVCHVTGSVRNVVTRDMIARGLDVTNWGTVAATSVAEHALLMVLGLLRSVPHWADAVAGNWSQADRDRLNVRSLYGRRVSIHGFGQVARELLKLLVPFNVDVTAYSPGVPAKEFTTHSVRRAESMRELAEQADVFVTCEALRDETANSVSREVLQALPRGAVFVNVGRGAIVDEDALADVGLERDLRVGSDVFKAEPLPNDSRLLQIRTSLFTPHIAGPTPDVYHECGRFALANLERFLSGRPLENTVPLHVYDRST